MDLPAMINLRPSHALLNPNFDGYKLSLEPIPIIKSVLNAAPRRVFTNDDQYTFLHAKLFSLHNHLFRDPWLEYSCYFLDDNWAIQNVRYDTASGQLSSIKSVHKLPKSNVGRGDYNPSLCFVSEKYCVFTDGCGTLKILDTGDRYRVDEWKATFSCPMLDDSIPFVIQDARWEIIEGVHQIQCLTLSIQRKNDESDDKFETVIDWFVIKKDAELSAWNKSHVRQLRGNTLPDYCVLEPKCNGLLLSADKRFQFSFDSENPIENIVKTEEKVAAEEDASKNEFIWTQSDEDVTVHFKISRETQKRDIKVVCDGKMLQVRHKNDVLLDAELFERIDGDLTTWNLENESLQITLMKQEPAGAWNSLLKDVEIQASELPAQPVRDLSLPPASSLQSQMEECDYGDDDMDRDYSFVRIDAKTHQTTHKIQLGTSNAVLFSLSLRAAYPPAFALRNDVDVCVWLPQVQPSLSNEVTFNVRHEGTLNAFGYIQASKQQRKFIQCSPDFNYSLVCEPHRHIFVYKSAYDTASGLKNRNSSQKISIGQQKLITMDDSDEVLGVVCQNEVTFLLTQKNVLCLQINA